ncbi:hypothetical protein AAFF_G00237650 [Aldrovandia affinis]|uniref:Uncharacterized protein n=1 Tax=Aldrovandia affinis TaxID=143900 RepID=A0AAD7REK7_9TELE|nr:hypothetical protein AAFF_G00237650 [Aldrovandia affinis]
MLRSWPCVPQPHHRLPHTGALATIQPPNAVARPTVKHHSSPANWRGASALAPSRGNSPLFSQREGTRIKPEGQAGGGGLRLGGTTACPAEREIALYGRRSPPREGRTSGCIFRPLNPSLHGRRRLSEGSRYLIHQREPKWTHCGLWVNKCGSGQGTAK